MHVKIEKAAGWLGVAGIGVFLVLFVFVAGFIPPYDPSATAAETAARYAENELRIRIGMAFMIFLAFPSLRHSSLCCLARCDESRATGVSCR